MPAKITLLGALHATPEKLIDSNQYGISDMLLGNESDTLFAERWFKTFDDNLTLLILESASFHKNIITIDSPLYESEIKHISTLLVQSDFGPDILCADTRFKNLKSAKKIVSLNFTTLAHMNGAFGLVRIPETFEDAQKCYIDGRWKRDYRLMREIPNNIKRSVLEEDALNTEMEKYMLEQAEKYKNDYDQILIITGASHTLEMATTSQLPYEVLVETNSMNEIAQNYGMLLARKAKTILKC